MFPLETGKSIKTMKLHKSKEGEERVFEGEEGGREGGRVGLGGGRRKVKRDEPPPSPPHPHP
jgi:hypothetical protein